VLFIKPKYNAFILHEYSNRELIANQFSRNFSHFGREKFTALIIVAPHFLDIPDVAPFATRAPQISNFALSDPLKISQTWAKFVSQYLGESSMLPMHVLDF